MSDQRPLSPTTQTTKRIFVVEDQKDYRDVLVKLLQNEGFAVLQAENGQQALDIMKDTDCDLIILDILMPRMDGITFLYHLRNVLNKKNIPVIILTNFTEAAHPEGATDFLVKSNISLDEVVKKIRNYIHPNV